MIMKWPFAKEREEDARPLHERIQELVEQSDEPLVVLGDEHRVVAANRVARAQSHARPPADDAYEELRASFTAAVSHELRTPLARILALLETAALPGEDPVVLAEQARREVQEITELIDDVLFLGELETGRVVVALGATRALPVVEEVFEALTATAERAGVTLRAAGEPAVELPLRRRMLRVVVENLARNAIRYAGDGATLTISVASNELVASDDGSGVFPEDLPRLFERFFRADRARGTRGSGLGLAVVKHIVVAAGGSVEATGGPGEGLTIRCRFA
jgi:signal transduction histidine kinase